MKDYPNSRINLTILSTLFAACHIIGTSSLTINKGQGVRRKPFNSSSTLNFKRYALLLFIFVHLFPQCDDHKTWKGIPQSEHTFVEPVN